MPTQSTLEVVYFHRDCERCLPPRTRRDRLREPDLELFELLRRLPAKREPRILSGVLLRLSGPLRRSPELFNLGDPQFAPGPGTGPGYLVFLSFKFQLESHEFQVMFVLTHGFEASHRPESALRLLP